MSFEALFNGLETFLNLSPERLNTTSYMCRRLSWNQINNFYKKIFDFELPNCNELETYYISMDDQQIEDMLQSLNLKDVKELFAHISDDVKFDGEIGINEELNYNELTTHIKNIVFDINTKDFLYLFS